jgi:hypothetical protein
VVSRDGGATDAYRTPAPIEPAAPVLSPAPRRPRLYQVLVFLLVLPLAFYFGRRLLADAQGGTLLCSRAQNRCELESGWLIREREVFAAGDLQGAKVVRRPSRSVRLEAYGVDVITTGGSRKLGGASTARGEQDAIARTITTFAQDPSAPSLDAHLTASTFSYVIVSLLGLIYGFMGLALLIGWIRARHPRSV